MTRRSSWGAGRVVVGVLLMGSVGTTEAVPAGSDPGAAESMPALAQPTGPQNTSNGTADNLPNQTSQNTSMGSVRITFGWFTANDDLLSYATPNKTDDYEGHTLPMTVKKLNKSTFVAIHTHGTTTKKWYYANSSIHRYPKMRTPGWPGRLGAATNTSRLVYEIEHHSNTEDIKQFVSDVHEEKSGSEKEANLDLNPLPGPWQAVKDILNGILDSIKQALKKFVSGASDFLFMLPAPGNALKPLTWGPPWNGGFPSSWFKSVWAMYWGLAGVATIGLAVIATVSHSDRTTITGKPQHHDERTRSAVRSLIGVMLGWILISLWLHGMNVLIDGVAPNGSTFITSLKGVAQLGLGLIFVCLHSD